MFDKLMLRCSVLLLVGLGGTACSSVEPKRSPELRKLPSTPLTKPQRSPQLPRSTYIEPAFEEYKPQTVPQYAPPLDSFESYVPEKNYQDTYTTPFPEEEPVVVEVRKPEPVVTPKPEPVIETAVAKQRQQEDFRKNELDIDPYADIPEREILTVTRKNTPAKPAPAAAKKSLSAAANALLLAAKAESAVGRHDAAITKVERALRIEPQSPLLWHHLASFNYNNKRYDQAISLARKSLQLSSGNRDLVSKNLNLMSKAATKEGNTRVFREVMDYKKMNP